MFSARRPSISTVNTCQNTVTIDNTDPPLLPVLESHSKLGLSSKIVTLNSIFIPKIHYLSATYYEVTCGFTNLHPGHPRIVVTVLGAGL